MLPYHHNRLTVIALAVFFLCVIGYAIFEARTIVAGPQIELDTPENFISVTERLVIITGSAQNITEIRLNGNPITVTEAGVFEEPILLTPGYNKIVLTAEDKLGRETEKTIEIVYEPPEGAATTSPSAQLFVSAIT